MSETVNSCNFWLIETRSTPPAKARWLNVVLLAVAVAGWMIFVVACIGGPAWSPDGSKILFGYYDEANSRDVIAMYDRRTHKTTNLYAQPIPNDDKDDDEFILVPTWQADGTRALVGASNAVEDKLHCVLVSISVKPGEPLQAYNFGKTGLCYTAAMLPQFGDTVYLGGESDLLRVNLATGKIDSKSIEGGTGYISKHNKQLVYLRGAKRPAPSPDHQDATEEGMEFGQFDLKELSLKPFFTIWHAQVDELGLKDDFVASWEPNGTRIAMVGGGPDFDQIILLDEKKGFIEKLSPDLGVKSYHLGSLVWSHDGKTLYAPAITNGEKEKTYVYSLAEIPLARTSGRLTRIAGFHEDSMKEDEEVNMLNIGMQVSLSPDGKMIAASTATLRGAVAENERGLFLIDVEHPKHHITRIPVPKNAKGR